MLRSAVVLLVLAACSSEPFEVVGRECLVESSPADGYEPGDAYLEFASVFCPSADGGRICMLNLVGASDRVVPEETLEGCEIASGEDCERFPSMIERMHCTCRCSVEGGGTDETTCECPSGFSCAHDLISLGGDRIAGGYCIHDGSR